MGKFASYTGPACMDVIQQASLILPESGMLLDPNMFPSNSPAIYTSCFTS